MSSIGAFDYAGRKLQVLDHLVDTTDKIKHNLQIVVAHPTKSDDELSTGEIKAYSLARLADQGRHGVYLRALYLVGHPEIPA